MKRILSMWLSMAMAFPALATAQEKPLAAVGRVSVIGEIDPGEQQIIGNRLSAQLSLRYDLVSPQEYRKAEDEAFSELEAEQCTAANCIRKIQEFLQVERVFILQIVRSSGVTQLSLTLHKGNASRVVEDSCNNCTVADIYPRVDALVDNLAMEDLNAAAVAAGGAPGSAQAAGEKSPGWPWWVWALGAVGVAAIVLALNSSSGGGGSGNKDTGSATFTW